MKRFLVIGAIALATVGLPGCGANIPDADDIDPNPVADPDAMRKGIEEMRKHRADGAKGRDVGKVDIDKQVERSTGGGDQ